MNNKMYSIKYRPFSFKEMVGHKAILNELRNRSKEKNFPQVMIFEGLSGSGKTSLGLIIAGVLNCKNPIQEEDGSYSPCGECASCLDIKNERFNRDVYLFDASSMSKNDVLNIEDIVNTYPMYDPNQVIIIDEAQELSKAGKGATLRLLEKARKNTYFILCTMDEKALDKAIKSRGQSYRFNPIDKIEIAKHLYNILEKENLIDKIPKEFIEEGIFIISENANGNVREALQLLERVIYGGYYTKELISKELGLLSYDTSIELLYMLLEKNPKFFKKVKSINVKDFFYYSWKILLDAKIYQISKYVDNDWKVKSFEKVLSTGDIDKLLEIYSKMKINGYFIENNFYYYIIQYYNEYDNVTHQQLVRKLVRETKS